MSNSEVSITLESMKVQKGKINFPRHIAQENLNEEELIAAKVLYELANGPGSLLENGEGKKTKKNLGKRKVLEDGSTNNPCKKFKHSIAVRNTIDRSNYSAQSLCNKGIAENSGDRNYLYTEKGKLKAEAPSEKIFSFLESYHQPTFSSKTIQIPSETSSQLYSATPPAYTAEFSFSIIHLLSAVRLALITPPQGEYDFAFGSASGSNNQENCDIRPESVVWYKEFIENNLPSLSIDQIVQRLRSNPGDPRIPECEEPLIELVRGVLKTFASPTETIYWKPLAVYDRLKRQWRWTGPLPYRLTHQNCIKVDIRPIAWGLPQENLIELVVQFTIWLRRMKPRLQLIASLPSPPLELMQPKELQKRLEDRSKINRVTIDQSSDEIKAYFHREEVIRYLFIDKSFKYTTLDGAKSSVAPLQKDCEKALTKSHGHHIFKANRPPQFTLISLVRDASARLPGGVGTRDDICALVRHSQYIIGDIPEKKVKQIVSGALDRLSGEVDPCVMYNRKWGLWVYLHGEKEEEDFREDGTSSLKKTENDKNNSKLSLA